MQPRDPAQVLQDQRVVDAGVLPVAHRVDLLQVEEQHIQQRQQLGKDFPLRVAAGLHGRGDAFGFGQAQQRRAERRLHRRLAAGERQPAAVAVEGLIRGAPGP
jgi:hypothetical protein